MKYGAVLGLAILTGLAGLANFGYQVLVASALDPAAFSLVASILAIVAIVGASTGGLQVVTARAYSTRIGWCPEKRVFDKTTVQGLLIVAAATILMLALSPWLSSGLGISFPFFLLLLLFLPISVMTSLLLGKVQGSGHLLILGSILLALSTGKVASAFAVLKLGGGAVSLIAALILVSLLVLILGFLFSPFQGSSVASLFSLQTATLILAQLSFWGIATSDVIAARIGLQESDAGEFAAAATIAKVVLFLPGVLTTAILPVAGSLLSQGRSRTRFALWSVGLTGCLAVISAALVWLTAPWLIPNLLGTAYAGSVVFVGALAFAYVPLSLTGATLQFHFTSHRRRYSLLAGACFLAMLVAFLLGPANPWYYVVVVGATGTLLFVLLNLPLIRPGDMDSAEVPIRSDR